MLIYNSLTRKREEFVPREEGKVSMYTCGPTVYHFAHIGNLRTYIMEDVLEKYLSYVGYDVTRVMNITDVGHLSSDADTGEDKMLKGAKREKKTVMEIAQFYTEKFFEDCKALNIRRPEVVEPATSCIDEFIKVIESLLALGECFAQGSHNKAALLILHCGANVLLFSEVVSEVLSLLLADALPLRVARAVGKQLANLLVAFEHLHRKVARRKTLRQLLAMLLHILV